MGFAVAEGPEIEDDWHVFSGLNFPPEHPARDMQDTFFVERDPDILLRTHTSSVQVREMERREPPMRRIMPGRVFRNEAISARAHCMFHQIEGLCYIDKGVSFADLANPAPLCADASLNHDTDIRSVPLTSLHRAQCRSGCVLGLKTGWISASRRAPDGLRFWVVAWWIPMC